MGKMSIIRYFPLYIRSISSTAFSTKICEWRCLLSGLSVHLKDSKENSKDYDLMNNIVCSLLISLVLPAETPSYSVIQNNASGYLHLLKLVQTRALCSSSPSASSISNVISCAKQIKQFIGSERSPDNAQVRLDAFIDYVLYHEASFIDAIKDTKKMEYHKDISNGINLQSLLILKLLKVEKIMRDVKASEGGLQSAMSALLEHIPSTSSFNQNLKLNHDFYYTNLPLSEGMMLAIISAITVLVSQIFRMILGESSNAVVHITPHRRTADSVRDLLDRIMDSGAFIANLLNLLNYKSRNDDHIPLEKVIFFVSGKKFEDTLLHDVLSTWKTLMRQFCVIAGSETSCHKLLDSHTSALLRSLNELIGLFRSRCSKATADSGSPSAPCDSNCIACKTSFHRIRLIQKNTQDAARRVSSRKDEGRNGIVQSIIGNGYADIQALIKVFQ